MGAARGKWHREVVQRGEGLWFYQPGGWRRGRVRPLLGHLGRRVQDPGRGRGARVRRDAWPQGPAGGERSQGLTLEVLLRATGGVRKDAAFALQATWDGRSAVANGLRVRPRRRAFIAG